MGWVSAGDWRSERVLPVAWRAGEAQTCVQTPSFQRAEAALAECNVGVLVGATRKSKMAKKVTSVGVNMHVVFQCGWRGEDGTKKACIPPMI